jgi:hypothetical protein
MVKSSTGSPGVRTCGAHHPGVCGLDSGFGVIMGTVARCDSLGSHLACELGPLCKVKSDRFAVTHGYENLDLSVTS